MNKRKFNEYLTLRNSISDMRFTAIFNTLLYTDLFGILPLFGEPRVSFFIYLGVAPALVLNLWAIIYIFAPYRFELSFILYYGVSGTVNSFLYVVVIEKYLYTILHLKSWFFLFIGVFFYFASVVTAFVIQHLLVYEKINPPKGPGSWPKVMAFAPALGCFAGQFIFAAIKSEDTKALIFTGIMAVLMLVMLLFVQFIHKYLFFIKHKEALFAKYPYLNKPKKEQVNRIKSKKHKQKSNKKRKSR